MVIKDLKIRNFRNIKRIDWQPAPGTNVISGNNGEGKTNLLETLYILLNLKPLRMGKNFKPLINNKESSFFIRAQLIDATEKYEKILGYEEGNKKLQIDKQIVKAKEFIKNSYCIFFSPDEAGMVVDSPGVRRKLMDRFIFSLASDYYEKLILYKKLLKRRNLFLRDNYDSRLIKSLDKNFVPLANEITLKRAQFIKELSPLFSKIWKQLKPENIELSLRYDKSLDINNNDAGFKFYQQKYEQEKRMGRTNYGPHRDDFIFYAENIDSKHFLSHGERKIAAFSFNFAYLGFFSKVVKRLPVIMLDDISAELDRETLERVFNLLNTYDSQKFITVLSGKKQLLEDFVDFKDEKNKLYHIDNGSLKEYESILQ
ncbi:MAG: DNA replication and repair protein RecF [Deltaproteobacteria bacterium]|jgi:DNA replication and repair protein RecF|nr:DNA replication and repair protein RecF [Deltaproteobacteria bacterium]